MQTEPPDTGKRLLIHEKREVAAGKHANLGWNVPPHVSFVAVCDRSADEGATGTDASCFDPDHDECLWTGHVVVEERSEWEGCGDGAQADESERLKP